MRLFACVCLLLLMMMMMNEMAAIQLDSMREKSKRLAPRVERMFLR